MRPLSRGQINSALRYDKAVLTGRRKPAGGRAQRKSRLRKKGMKAASIWCVYFFSANMIWRKSNRG